MQIQAISLHVKMAVRSTRRLCLPSWGYRSSCSCLPRAFFLKDSSRNRD